MLRNPTACLKLESNSSVGSNSAHLKSELIPIQVRPRHTLINVEVMSAWWYNTTATCVFMTSVLGF
jgi:hypothetical protein